jgi:oligopeptidase A
VKPAPANPLLSEDFRIPFDRIGSDDVAPGVREVLAEGRRRLDVLADCAEPPTWENTVEPLDETARWVSERITPVNHLMAVAETPALREAWNEVLPEVSQFWTRLVLHEGVWARLRAYEESPEAAGLSGIRRRHLEKTLLEFRRSGADLPADARARFEEVEVRLSQLSQRFSENVLDATAAWEHRVTDEARLEGLPEGPRARFRRAAEERGFDGWLLTLDRPAVEPVLKYVRDRELRRTVYAAYTTRCREGDHDNRGLILEILRLREEKARLLGYDGYPDYVLEERMAKSGADALAFERELTAKARAYWRRDAEELRRHGRELGLDALRPWDVSFVMEDLRRREYDLDEEDLRPYFPLERVERGLFELVERVFGFSVEAAQNDAVWHDDVGYYQVRDEEGVLRGAFYTDWFPRKEKRQGAWMNDFRSGGPTPGGFDPHLGVICGNFTPPEGDTPALLTHREVETLFHEFGHLLHHTASTVPVRSRGGLNVAWDWVELPSQIMENWCWEREALDLFARHHETGEPLPDDLFRRMVEARRFMGGWSMMRQLSFGTVDLLLHTEFAPGADTSTADELMEWARARFLDFAAEPDFADWHILTAFSHLFAGGYAAGYYSYLWSEVLEADAFTRFRDEGVFSRRTGRAYVDAILSRGDSADPELLFREFMGRDPDPMALVDRNLGPAPTPVGPHADGADG